MRLKSITILVLALTAPSAARTATAQIDAAALARRVLPGVVHLQGEGGSIGSGFFVDADGTLVTSLHVVARHTGMSVRLQSGDIYEVASVLAADVRRHIVILKVAGFDLPSLDLENSNDIEVGEAVLVAGSPLGLESTVTTGIVSAIRDHPDGFKLIQTDAAANPGNSGGPIVDQTGAVIGVVASKLPDSENVNFAIPINYVRGMLDLPFEPISLAELNESLPEDVLDPAEGADAALDSAWHR